MKISIITVVLNDKKNIKNSIESVLNQTFDDIEYLIIDGASTDGTIELVLSYNKRISKFISEPDKGIYDALNKGISLASGNIIGFLHSDDLYPNDKIIEKIVAQFSKDSNLDGVYGDLIYTRKGKENKILRYWKSEKFNSKLLKYGWMPAHPTFFLKKEVYQEFGVFNLDFKIAADYDLMLRVLNNGIKVRYLPEVLYKMQVGGESNKSIANMLKKSKEDFQILKKNNVGGFYTLIFKNLSKIRQFFSYNKNV